MNTIKKFCQKVKNSTMLVVVFDIYLGYLLIVNDDVKAIEIFAFLFLVMYAAVRVIEDLKTDL